MGKNLTMVLSINSLNNMGWFLGFYVLIIPLKMAICKIKTINNIVRTMLPHASMPPSFWHHALVKATYLHNILPTKILAYKTPTHIIFQKNPSYSHLRVFGCLSFPLFPSTQIHKLQPRSTLCIFLGYPYNIGDIYATIYRVAN